MSTPPTSIGSSTGTGADTVTGQADRASDGGEGKLAEKWSGAPLGFVGTGNMAEALIKGLLREGTGLITPDAIWGSEPRQARIDLIKQRYGIHMTKYNVDVVRHASTVVLSVKPQILTAVCDEIAPHLKPKALVVSVAAGVPLAVLEAHLPKNTRVVRAMPNTPALVGAGATARRTALARRRPTARSLFGDAVA